VSPVIKVGMMGDVPIMADIGGGLGEAIPLVLRADYAMESPPGFPTRPSFTGAGAAHPPLLRAGAKITVHAAEAKALIAAGAARYDPAFLRVRVTSADGHAAEVPLAELISFCVSEIKSAIVAECAPIIAAEILDIAEKGKGQ
jgi:hypothetical protein